MRININDDSAETSISLVGSFDAAAAPEAKRIFTSLVDQGKKSFIVDFSGVDFIDSSGLGALIGFLKRTKLVEGTLSLANISPGVERVLKLTHLTEIFHIIDNRDAA